MATLNSVIDKQNKLMFYISDAKNLGIEILGADVNKSQELYTIEGNSIRTGLKALRNVGKMAGPIIEERNKHGIFKNFEDFIDRMLNTIDKRVLESLIYSGAVDCFDGTRSSKINSVPDILEFIKNIKKGLFPEIPFRLPIIDKIYVYLKKLHFDNIEEYDKQYLLEQEYKYTGMYISGHPLDDYLEFLKAKEIVEIGRIVPDTSEEFIENEKLESEYDGQNLAIAGIIRDLKKIITKKGENMFICSLEDITGTLKTVIFPKVTESCLPWIEENKLVIMEGKIEDNEKGCQMIVGNIKDIKDLTLESKKRLYINCPKGVSNDLKDFLSNPDNKGLVPVYIQIDKKLFKWNNNIHLDWNNFSYLKNNYQIILK